MNRHVTDRDRARASKVIRSEVPAQGTRSPFDQPLPRYPGQSLDEYRRRRFEEWIDPMFMASMIAVALAGWSWFSWWQAKPPSLLLVTLMTFVAVGFVAYTAYRVIRFRHLSRGIQLGIEGERAVAAILDRLRESGFEVLHDLVGQEEWNLDHVVVGPPGVFTVETKARRKPISGPCVVHYDRTQIYLNGTQGFRYRNPLVQAKAQARWLRRQLRTLTGGEYFVQPVILFPQWYIEHRDGPPLQQPVWVFNPEMFVSMLPRCPRQLTAEQVRQVAGMLRRHFGETPRA